MSSVFDDMRDDLPFAASAAPTEKTPMPTDWLGFKTKCGKCGGTGKFRSFAGRILGDCFACKGAGNVVHKTSPETRAKSAASRVARQAKTDATRWLEFAAKYPAEAKWIEANPSFDFASRMQADVHRFGSLTEGKLAAIGRCLARDVARTTERSTVAARAPEMTLEPVEKAFSNAREAGIKFPRLNLDVFTFKPAKVGGANEGAIYVTEGETYLGKVMGGKFLRSRDCADEQQAKILEIAVDPLAAAVAYGKRFGSCAVCRRELSNEESIERGIGPICAEKFGW